MDLRFTLEAPILKLNDAAQNLADHLKIVPTTAADRAVLLSLLPAVTSVLAALGKPSTMSAIEAVSNVSSEPSAINAAIAGSGQPSAIRAALRTSK